MSLQEETMTAQRFINITLVSLIHSNNLECDEGSDYSKAEFIPDLEQQLQTGRLYLARRLYLAHRHVLFGLWYVK